MIFGVGTDLIEIDRIRQAIEKNPRFLEKVYTEAEISYCQRKKIHGSLLRHDLLQKKR